MAGLNLHARRRIALYAATCAMSFMACVSSSLGADFPTRPVRIVLPAAPGAAYDVLLRGRGINAHLTQKWGYQIVVDNRPGGSGIIGTEIVARSAPDGHTLLLVTTAFTTNPFLQKKLPYATPSDFTPICMVASAPNVLVAHPAVAVSNGKELIALARDKPGQLTYASSGAGSGGHLSMELLKRMAGIDILHIPYKSASPALTDLIGGQVQLLFTAIASAIPHIRSNRLKALMVSSARRAPALPETPTVAESGVPGYAVDGWYGILGPKGIPKPVVQKINQDLAAVLAMPDVIAHLGAYGFEAGGSSPDEFERYIKNELAKWEPIIRAAGIRVE
jgi:tripartite-type tricarboxylate transporter receptor subunit TctC